jgi:hypothetical protein
VAGLGRLVGCKMKRFEEQDPVMTVKETALLFTVTASENGCVLFVAFAICSDAFTN